jgi:site-specific DNA recombinase
VAQIFSWVGTEGRTLYWVVNKLNEIAVPAPEGGKWSPARLANVVHRHCYTGNHAYNANARVPNPDRPLGDITAEVKRTLLRLKPRDEWVTFKVPALISEQLWQKANAGITERGRGKGKAGKSIKALLRNRIFCPRCGKPMVVRRDGRQQRVYYHCSKYFRPWADNPCSYNKFVPGTWDDLVWDCVYALLKNDVWLEQQLASEQSQDENMAKLLKLHRYKISQAQSKIARVREGFEGGIYSLDEAKQRIAECEAAIAKAEQEPKRLQTEMNRSDAGAADIEAIKRQLKALRERNLEDASFEDKLDIIAKFGIRVYPSEDLKTMRVTCGLNLQFENDGEDESAVECRKVMFGSPFWTKGKTFEKTFALVF